MDDADLTGDTVSPDAAPEAAPDASLDASPVPATPPALSTLEHEGEVAADYLEALLDILDLDGDLEIDVEGDRAAVALVGAGLEDLVGVRGATVDALQELTRLAVLRATGERSRLLLDIAGWRVERRRELEQLGREVAERVAGSGQAETLAAMNPFERKVVHDAVGASGHGLVTESEGEEPNRRIVVAPA